MRRCGGAADGFRNRQECSRLDALGDGECAVSAVPRGLLGSQLAKGDGVMGEGERVSDQASLSSGHRAAPRKARRIRADCATNELFELSKPIEQLALAESVERD